LEKSLCLQKSSSVIKVLSHWIVPIELKKSMLKSEESILNAVNEVGTLATSEAIEQFDTDGSPIQKDSETWTSFGAEAKAYQTPYGEAAVSRHIYQSSKGGQVYCPLEDSARIVVTSTPQFARIVSSKYANMPSTQVQRDLCDNHGRSIARSCLQKLSEAVGHIAQKKEEDWHYVLPKSEKSVKTVTIGVDGTCMLLCKEGYREAMVGTISFYDKQGERQHTIYLSATPEYGKATFWRRMEREIAQVKSVYPQATYVGIADGAKDNWSFLEQHTQKQILDFYHATSYLKAAAFAAVPMSQPKRNKWINDRCHSLKYESNAATQLLEEMKTFQRKKLSNKIVEQLESSITYFENHIGQMNYAQSLSENIPIGSGVTEAACKTLVKQRLCQSGMKWLERGASIVLGLRTLAQSPGRWKQFWNKINQYGLPVT
jgi:hypothetical protein